MFHLHLRASKTGQAEAIAAAAAAKVELVKVKAAREEVSNVVRASREFRRKNHFAEDLQKLFGGV